MAIIYIFVKPYIPTFIQIVDEKTLFIYVHVQYYFIQISQFHLYF